VLDAVVATVVDVGYYKASSNEIARRAGVTWGTIQHLFGSREQLMLEVVHDFGERLARGFASTVVTGEALEDRLESLYEVLSRFYEDDTYLVQLQILLDLSANPKLPAQRRRAVLRSNSLTYDSHALPMLSRALGGLAAEGDLVLYAFMTMRSHLISRAISRHIVEIPPEMIGRLSIATGQAGPDSDDLLRAHLLRGIATVVREEAERRGYDVDEALRKPPPELG
jgi:AcrR family transcriptional regulator